MSQIKDYHNVANSAVSHNTDADATSDDMNKLELNDPIQKSKAIIDGRSSEENSQNEHDDPQRPNKQEVENMNALFVKKDIDELENSVKVDKDEQK